MRTLIDTCIVAAAATAKFMSATTTAHGQDCIAHAELLQQLLLEQGLDAKLVVGRAAWRYGPEDGAVICHMPEIAPLCGGDFSGHAWVEVGDLVVDATLWSLPEKVRVVEQVDPRGTTNHWTLPVLVADKHAVGDFAKVRDGYSLGAFYQADGAVFNQMEK